MPRGIYPRTIPTTCAEDGCDQPRVQYPSQIARRCLKHQRAWQREYARTHVEQRQKYLQRSYNHRGLRMIWQSYRSNARRKSLDFDLSEAAFVTLTQQPCHYCGALLSNTARNTFPYNGVDRVDNTQGYIEGNVVSCCRTCNLAKRAMTTLEFLTWVDRVAAYQHG